MTDAQQTVGAAPEGTCEAVGSAPTFREELEHLINRHSKENGSNTPDYMLADFLCTCLVAFDATGHSGGCRLRAVLDAANDLRQRQQGAVDKT